MFYCVIVDLFFFFILFVFFFFFFQAEDGIRDGHVTGVQTCALPISAPTVWPTRAISSRLPRHSKSATTRARWSPNSRATCGRPRSEERRVGKECRSRWSAYQ